jgi:serine phosphatase RsbU (regulator of sigma subunit)
MSARIDKKTMDTLSHTNHLVDELREAVSSANEALFESRQQLERQQKIVARVHRSLLPSPVKCDHVDVDVRYLPVDTVGGDYCQVRFPTPTCCYITMCDISGEGIAPALLATRVSSEVRHCIMDGMSPHEIVRSLNSFVYEYFRDTGMLVTFIAARIDLEQKTMNHCSAAQ